MSPRAREWNNVIGSCDVGPVALCEQLPAVLKTLALDQTAQGQDGLTAGVTPAHARALHALRHLGNCSCIALPPASMQSNVLQAASTTPEPIGSFCAFISA